MGEETAFMIAGDIVETGEMAFTMAKVIIGAGVTVTMMYADIFVLGVSVFTILRAILCTRNNRGMGRNMDLEVEKEAGLWVY